MPKDAKAGLYRNTRDHDTIKVENKNGVLTFGGQPFDGAVRFANDKMFLPNPVYGDDVWERVEPWTPADLGAFTGVYASDEAETVLRVVVENGKLVMHRRPDASFTLEPTYADAFASPLDDVRFLRDTTGKIVALSLASGRVWDLRFTRQNPDTPAVPH